VAGGGNLVSIGVLGVTGMEPDQGGQMTDSPWDMLSAIGTMTAVIVALGVSGHASWSARRVEKDRSELAAAKMLSPISALESKVTELYGWFVFEDEEFNGDYTKIFLQIQELDVAAKAISVEDLYPLLHLKNHTAKRAAMALGLIHSFAADVTGRFMHHSWSKVTQRQPYHERWADMLLEIKDHLQIALSACTEAAATGAPRPTPQEIHGQ